MRVKMKVSVSGSRDGRPWPPLGGELDVPDDEGAHLCAVGMATPVTDSAETAVPSTEDVETRGLTETEKEADKNAAESRADSDDVTALQKQAEEAGVKVDKRWKADRLRQEIAAAKKA